MGGRKLITAPTDEPVSLEEVRAHLRLSSTDEDAYLEALTKAVRRAVEGAYDLAVLAQTWELALDTAPRTTALEVTPAPLLSVTSVTSYDDRDAATVMSSTRYTVDTYARPGRIVLKRDEVWPTDLRVTNALIIRYVAGLAATPATLAEDVKHGLLTMIATLYEQRETIHDVTKERVQTLSGEWWNRFRSYHL